MNKKEKKVFYSEISNKLPDGFYQRIVEKENEINLSKNLSQQSVEELIQLYKKVIEYYAFLSPEKVEFFSQKLVKLYVTLKKNASKQKHEDRLFDGLDKEDPIRSSEVYENKHKKNVKQVMVYLQIDKANEIITDMINKCNANITQAETLMINELNQQQEMMNKKIEAKKQIQKVVNAKKEKILNRRTDMEKLNSFVEDSLKKFHFIYKNSPLFESVIKGIQKIFEEVYTHKVQKFYYYQEQIKQFELLMGGDEEAGEQYQESFQFYVSDLISEREKYFKEIQSNLVLMENKIKEACLEYNIKDTQEFEKFKLEFLNNLIKTLH